MKPIQFLSNEVWCTMWDTKEAYSTKYQQKAKEHERQHKSKLTAAGVMAEEEAQPIGGPDARQGWKEVPGEDQGYFWFMDFEDNKYCVTRRAMHTT